MTNFTYQLSNATANLTTYKYTPTSNISQYVNSIAKQELILNETDGRVNEAYYFSKKAHNAESSIFSYQIACIVLIPLLTIGALVLFKFKKQNLVVLMSVLIFAFIVPACVILGLNLSSFLVSIDLCQDLNKYVTQQRKPISGQGVGVYLKCPNTDTTKDIKVAKYQLSKSFNDTYNELSASVAANNDTLGQYKRKNSDFIAKAGNYTSKPNIVNGLQTLIATNNALESLIYFDDCVSVLNIVNYGEEKVCYKNITYQFNNLFFYFCSIFGLIFLAIGINRLYVVLSPKYGHKKPHNMELLKEIN
jgi:hypothetical protein